MTVRRVKTYTADTGHVYQYYFVGQRPSLDLSRPGTEYVFDIILHDKGRYAVTVVVGAEGPKLWEANHGRQLSETECYACAKLRLLRAFDELEDLPHSGRVLWVEPDDIETLLAPLNLD